MPESKEENNKKKNAIQPEILIRKQGREFDHIIRKQKRRTEQQETEQENMTTKKKTKIKTQQKKSTKLENKFLSRTEIKTTKIDEEK